MRFSEPVYGVGAWIFDDHGATANTHQMLVTELGGAVSTSPILDADNGTAYAVEGWISGRSTVGINKVVFRVLNEQNGTPSNSWFEIDHLQIATGGGLGSVPEPGLGLTFIVVLGVGALLHRLKPCSK